MPFGPSVVNITEVIFILVASIAFNDTEPSLSLWLHSGSIYDKDEIFGFCFLDVHEVISNWIL